MFATNWSSSGGLAAEASVTCRRSQWSISSHFSLLFSPPKRFFCDMTTTPKLGTKDLLKAQRWVVERESNLLPLLYKPLLNFKDFEIFIEILSVFSQYNQRTLKSLLKKCPNETMIHQKSIYRTNRDMFTKTTLSLIPG